MSEKHKDPQKFISKEEAKRIMEKYLEDNYEREVFRITQKRKKVLSQPIGPTLQDIELNF